MTGGLLSAASQSGEQNNKRLRSPEHRMTMKGKLVALGAVCVWITVRNGLEDSDDLSKIDKRKVEVDFMDPPPLDSVTDLFTGSRTRVDLTTLISRLMEGEDPEPLRREYGSELVEEAISVLENRI